MIMLAVLFLIILKETGVFIRTSAEGRFQKIAVLSCMLYYFAIGSVEPVVYNGLMCMIFVLIISYYRMALEGPAR